MTDSPTSKDQLPLIEWARKRFERSVRLAKVEEPADGDVSFEDAVYFREMLAILERATPEPEALRRYVHEQLGHLAGDDNRPAEALIRLAAERLAQPPAPEWQPIETAPKDGTPVLVSNDERDGAWIAYYQPVYSSGYRPDNPWSSLMLNMRWHTTKWASTVPTKWMPIPAPCSTATKEGGQ